MKYKRTIRITAYFMLITGTINLLMWTFLIASGQVEDFSSEPVAYVFHWISEFATALLLLSAGIHVLRSNTPRLNLVFLALGSLLMAIGGAFYFYITHFETALVIFTAVFTGATIFFIFISYRGFKDFIFLTAGLVLYGLINVMGQGFQEGNQTLVSMALPATLFILVLIVGLLRKEIRLGSPSATPNRHSGEAGKI